MLFFNVYELTLQPDERDTKLIIKKMSENLKVNLWFIWRSILFKTYGAHKINGMYVSNIDRQCVYFDIHDGTGFVSLGLINIKL